MDPLTPIAGVDVQLYAWMCAAMVDLPRGDRSAHAAVAEGFGLDAGRWNAADHGWSARMADPRYRCRVAPIFEPLYRDAVARRRGEITAAVEHKPGPRGPGLFRRLWAWF